MTANEIKNKDFSKSLGNYKTGEVRAYLDQVSQAFGLVVAENDSLKGRVRELERALEEYEKREGMLRESIMAADAAAEEIRAEGRKEADETVSAAKKEAGDTLCAAQKEAEELLAATRKEADALREAEQARLEEARQKLHELQEKTAAYKEKVESVIDMQRRLMNELL